MHRLSVYVIEVKGNPMALPKFNIHDEWRWIVGHSWSFRLLIAAATLSGAQAALPLFMDHPPLPRKIFAVVVFLIVSLAMILNLIVAERPPVILVPEPVPAPAAVAAPEPAPPVAQIAPVAVAAPESAAPAAPAQVTK
jgi:hypothetical protein